LRWSWWAAAWGGGDCSQEDPHVAVSDAVAGSQGIPSSWIIVAVVVGFTAIFCLGVRIPDSHQEAQAETALDAAAS
jgi:hypothetical protein